MREIKFRAWDKVNKRLILGGDIHVTFCGVVVTSCLDLAPNISGGYILLQYTGLRDKNDVEVYDGDIVKVVYKNNIYLHKVFYDTFSFKTSGAFCIEEILTDQNTDIHGEVVGNIYENPELLTGLQ